MIIIVVIIMLGELSSWLENYVTFLVRVTLLPCCPTFPFLDFLIRLKCRLKCRHPRCGQHHHGWRIMSLSYPCKVHEGDSPSVLSNFFVP